MILILLNTSRMQIDPSGEWLAVEFDGRAATYGVEMLNEIDLAYAMTVHKAQGSEYRCVVMAALRYVI